MATPRDIRRFAFQALFQLDARPAEDAEAVRVWLDDEESLTAGERDKALALARGAFARRAEADAELESLAPGWPAGRQPAVDRAILRLAWHEITSGRTPPKVAVNEAVELAKAFGTERSPAFVNGVLDKVLKRYLASAAAPAAPN